MHCPPSNSLLYTFPLASTHTNPLSTPRPLPTLTSCFLLASSLLTVFTLAMIMVQKPVHPPFFSLHLPPSSASIGSPWSYTSSQLTSPACSRYQSPIQLHHLALRINTRTIIVNPVHRITGQSRPTLPPVRRIRRLLPLLRSLRFLRT